jgi:YD repeat-containing protein
VGVTGRQDYSAYGELANLDYRFDGSTVFQQSMVRDALGRITALQEVAFGTDSFYGYRYDDAGRLYAVTTNGDTTARYWYDANGNRTAFQGRTATDTATADYDEQDRLLRYRDTRYSYTAAGEQSLAVTGADTTRYTYDALGNLLSVVAIGDMIGYLVDGRNRRVGRTLNGRLVQGWLYQNGLNPVAELDSAGNVVARYVYGTRGHVPDYVVKGAATYRLITDQLGSVRGVVNATSGAVAEQIDYDVWGRVKRDTDPGFVSLGYAGGLRDTATGLVRLAQGTTTPAWGGGRARIRSGLEAGTLDSTHMCSQIPRTGSTVPACSVALRTRMLSRALRRWPGRFGMHAGLPARRPRVCLTSDQPTPGGTRGPRRSSRASTVHLPLSPRASCRSTGAYGLPVTISVSGSSGMTPLVIFEATSQDRNTEIRRHSGLAGGSPGGGSNRRHAPRRGHDEDVLAVVRSRCRTCSRRMWIAGE